MSEVEGRNANDVAPGFVDAPYRSPREGLLTYAIGFALAAALTVGSFFVVRTDLIWGPGIVMALVALAIAQIGVHLVFFLHLTSAPDNTNNALALAFGVLIVTLVVGGSLWIMSHLDHNMTPGRMAAQTHVESFAAEGAVQATGVVAPREPEQVDARIAGVVASVGCETGMHVEAGRLCAEIDPQPYRAAVDRKANELQAAKARLARDSEKLGAARAALERQAGGRRRGAVARLRRSVERQEKRVDGAKTEVERAQAALAAAEAELAETRIVSPIEGTIRSRNVELGHEVSAKAKAPLFVVVPDTARIAAMIGSAQIGRISVGDRAILSLDALPGQEFYGAVTKIEPPRDGAEAIVDIVAQDPRHVLEPGMATSLRISPRSRESDAPQ